MVELIVGCVGVYGERIEQASVCIKRLRPHIDRYVVIVDESVTEDQKQHLKDLGCEVYFHPWEDSMVKMRNQYLEKCQTDDWIMVHDPDEWFCEKFCEDTRKICEKADKEDLVLLLINSHDITYQADGTKTESISDFFKNLIFQKKEGTHYEGVGEVKEVHETLIIPGLTRAMRLPKETYWYEHVKYWHEVWERAARNVFLAGGGNNVGERNPSWKPLREICDDLGLDNWPSMRDYLRKGKINRHLREWLWENRIEGFDFDHEEMEFGRWYFEYLHLEEKEFPDGRIWEPVHEIPFGTLPEVMRYVEQTYMEVLGRHADQAGKESYSKAILEGRMRREDLSESLKRSLEYQQKVAGPPSTPGERIRIPVPVNVDVQITEDIFLEALKKSGTYWEIIKPKIDVGSFILDSIWNREEFLKEFYEKWDSLTIRELFEMLLKSEEEKPAIGDDGINWDEDSKRATEQPYPYTDGSTFEYFKELIKPHFRVLEVGCQIASWLWAWRDIEPTIEYVGVDLSSHAIKVARKRYPECEFHLMNARDMDFHDEFDIVFTHTFLQHTNLRTKEIVIPKMWKALKEKGLLIIQEKSDVETETNFTEEGWIKFITERGFDLVKSHDQGSDGRGYVFKKELRR